MIAPPNGLRLPPLGRPKPLPEGAFASIQAAIDHLETSGGGVVNLPAGRLTVPAGGLVLRGAVTLVGAPEKTTRLRGKRSPLIRVEGGRAELLGLNLKSSAEPAVTATGGTLEVRDCLFKAQREGHRSTGVTVEGSDVRATITGSQFVGARLMIAQGSEVRVEGSRFEQGKDFGVQAEKTALIIDQCTFEKCRGPSLSLQIGARATVSQSTFSGGLGHAIALFGFETEGLIRNNTISSHKGHGVFVTGDARAEVLENTISNQRATGVYFTGYHVSGTVSNNTLIDNQGDGIAFRKLATGIVADNAVSGSACGVHIEAPEAGMRIERNQLRENQVGLRFDGSGGAQILANTLGANGTGMSISGRNASPTLAHNTIARSRHAGVQISREATPQLTHNTITENGDDGVLIINQGTSAVLRENQVTQNAGHGIHFGTGASGFASENDVAHGRQAGIAVEGADTRLTLTNNRVHENEAAGVRLAGGSRATLRRNAIFQNRASGILVEGEALPVIKHNRVYENRGSGLAFEGRAAGEVAKNDLANNDAFGVEVREEGTAPILRGNQIHGNRGGGLSFDAGATGEARENEIFGHPRVSVRLTGSSTRPRLRWNRIRDGEQSAILIRDAGGQLIENTITHHRASGVLIVDPSEELVLVGNRITENTVGVQVEGHSGGTLRANDLAGNSIALIGTALDPTSMNNTLALSEGDATRLQPERILLLFSAGAFRSALASARSALRSMPEASTRSPWAILTQAASVPPEEVAAADLWWVQGCEALLAGSKIEPEAALEVAFASLLAAERDAHAGTLVAMPQEAPKSLRLRAALANFRTLRTSQVSDAPEKAHEIFSRPAQAWQEAASAWPGVGPLPNYLRQEIRALAAEGDLNGLFARLGASGLPGTRQRRLVRAALEVFLDPRVGEPALARALPETGDECALCLDDLSDQTSFRLARCGCEGNFCRDCVRTHLEKTRSSLYLDACPEPQCGAQASRQDYETLGLEKKAIDARLFRQLATSLQRRPNFAACSTPECLGGIERSQAAASEPFTCALCSTINAPGMATVDTLIVRKLLHGLFPSKTSRGNGATRSCYGCGLATEKGEACAHMSCRACKTDWDFVQGEYGGTPRFDERGIGPQRYRPKKDGILEQLGFWPDSIPPGTLLTDQQVKEVLARATEWLGKMPEVASTSAPRSGPQGN